MIVQIDNGYVISSKGMWLPGIYEDIKTARYAFQFSNEHLQKLSHKICNIKNENRPITKQDLQEKS